MMRLLLTSSGITNESIHAALEGLLAKPVAEASALFVPTGMYPFSVGPQAVWRTIVGAGNARLCGLGWKSLGLLELTALPSIAERTWRAAVDEADALLVWGGDPLFLAYWMERSGLAEYLRTLKREFVYVGVSAGSMAAAGLLAESWNSPPDAARDVLSEETMPCAGPNGPFTTTLVTARGIGLYDFAIIPHFEEPGHEDAWLANAERWAAAVPSRVYAIDDASAVVVRDGNVDVVSEGRWKLFESRKK